MTRARSSQTLIYAVFTTRCSATERYLSTFWIRKYGTGSSAAERTKASSQMRQRHILTGSPHNVGVPHSIAFCVRLSGVKTRPAIPQSRSRSRLDFQLHLLKVHPYSSRLSAGIRAETAPCPPAGCPRFAPFETWDSTAPSHLSFCEIAYHRGFHFVTQSERL